MKQQFRAKELRPRVSASLGMVALLLATGCVGDPAPIERPPGDPQEVARDGIVTTLGSLLGPAVLEHAPLGDDGEVELDDDGEPMVFRLRKAYRGTREMTEVSPLAYLGGPDLAEAWCGPALEGDEGAGISLLELLRLQAGGNFSGTTTLVRTDGHSQVPAHAIQGKVDREARRLRVLAILFLVDFTDRLEELPAEIYEDFESYPVLLEEIEEYAAALEQLAPAGEDALIAGSWVREGDAVVSAAIDVLHEFHGTYLSSWGDILAFASTWRDHPVAGDMEALNLLIDRIYRLAKLTDYRIEERDDLTDPYVFTPMADEAAEELDELGADFAQVAELLDDRLSPVETLGDEAARLAAYCSSLDAILSELAGVLDGTGATETPGLGDRVASRSVATRKLANRLAGRALTAIEAALGPR